jgi:predicted SnoaL-like aldol condensation-catalyzing enzyme
MFTRIAIGFCLASGMFAGTAFAQGQGCTAEVEQRNMEIVAQFPSADVVSESYIQHNPAFKKRGEEAGMTDFAYMMSVLGGGNRGGGGGRAGGGGGGRGPAANVPQGTSITMADCDMVTTIRSRFEQDPNEADGVLSEQWGFDTFRVEGGLIVEHWDAASIQPE